MVRMTSLVDRKTANIVQPHAPCMHTWVSVIAVLYQNAVLTTAMSSLLKLLTDNKFPN